MYGMQDERKPQDAPKVALTHQERMRREEAKKAIAADKDPTLAQINEGDLATPELRRLAAEFPQLMLPPDDPSRMSVPPEIVVRASLLLKQRDDNASQNSTAIIDESLRRREVRNSFGMILGYGDPAGTARIDLTGMRAPGTETAEEIRYGEMRARERREREWGEALAKIGGMTTDMIMALGGAMGQMGSGPRMQTSPGMLGLRDGQRMAPGEWNRPGSQMGTWWESLPTAAQQGINVGARSAKMRGEVPMITPEGPISLTRSRQPGEPLQPTLQGGAAASQIAGASANPRLTETTPALQLSAGTRQGMVSTPTTSTDPLQLGMMQRTPDALPLTSPEIKLLPSSSTPLPTEPAKQKTTAQLRAELSDQLRMAQKVGDKQAIAEIKERLKTISKPNEPKGATVQPRTLADVEPKNSSDVFWSPAVQVFNELAQKYPQERRTVDGWMTLAEREYPGVISKQEKSALKLEAENLSNEELTNGLRGVGAASWVRRIFAPEKFTVLSRVKGPLAPDGGGLRKNEVESSAVTNLGKASAGYYNWLVKPSPSQSNDAFEDATFTPYTLVTQVAPESVHDEFREAHYDFPGLENLVSRVRGHLYKNDFDEPVLLISEIQKASSDEIDDLPIEGATRYTAAISATLQDVIKRNANANANEKIKTIEIASPYEIDALYRPDAPTDDEIEKFSGATVSYQSPGISNDFLFTAADLINSQGKIWSRSRNHSDQEAVHLARELTEAAKNDPFFKNKNDVIKLLLGVEGFSENKLSDSNTTWDKNSLLDLKNAINRIFNFSTVYSYDGTNFSMYEFKNVLNKQVQPYLSLRSKDNQEKLMDEYALQKWGVNVTPIFGGETHTIQLKRSKLRNLYIDKIFPDILQWGKRHGVKISRRSDGRLEIPVPQNAKPKSMPIAKVALTKRDRSDELA